MVKKNISIRLKRYIYEIQLCIPLVNALTLLAFLIIFVTLNIANPLIPLGDLLDCGYIFWLQLLSTAFKLSIML